MPFALVALLSELLVALLGTTLEGSLGRGPSPPVRLLCSIPLPATGLSPVGASLTSLSTPLLA